MNSRECARTLQSQQHHCYWTDKQIETSLYKMKCALRCPWSLPPEITEKQNKTKKRHTHFWREEKKKKEKVKEWRVVFIPQPFYIFTMKSAIAALHNVRTQTAVSHSCCSCLGQLRSQLSMDSLTCCSHKWCYWVIIFFQWSGCKWGQEHFGFLTSNTKYMGSPLLY